MAKGYFGTLDWGNWAYGLFAGFIGGGANAVVNGFSLAVSDPKDYAMGSSRFYLTILQFFVTSGLLCAFMFLKQKPLPDHITTVTKVEEIKQTGPAAILTKSVETTVVSTPEPPQ